MVNVNELRIGNLITYLEEIYVINGIKYEELNPNKWRISFITIDGKLGNAKGVDWIGPIPLAPEWLERLGFEYKDGASDYGHYRHNLVYIYEHDSDPGLFHFSRGHMEGAKVEVKHVHQLQNLFFALTGEELNAKL